MRHIAVAVDPTDRPEVLLAHGLKLALLHGATLTVCLVDRSGAGEPSWGRLPGVRAMLERWGVVEEDSGTAAYEALGIDIRPLEAPDADVVHALLTMLEARQPDLLVLGTQGRVGLDRMLHPSVAERVSRTWHGPTLVVRGGSTLVDLETGALNLDRVLLPISMDVSTQDVVDTTLAMLNGAKVAQATIHVMQVGDADPPLLVFPEPERWVWEGHRMMDVAVVEGVLTLAETLQPDLIAMGTRGHDSWIDAVMGSHTERVLRRAPCAVLTVPMRFPPV